MFQNFADELSGDLAVPLEIVLFRIVGATLLCGLVGLEREFQKNAAGIRTNMLIGLAACTFCLITLQLMEIMSTASDAARLDPIRLVEAVTAGVAFLAAGVVVYTKGDVQGLTTGASMWLSAAIGLAAGLGIWPIAVVVTVVGVIILWVLRHIEVAAGLKEK